MKNKKIIITIYFLIITSISFSQVLSNEENKLYDIIMKYRKENGLPSIPFSASLTYVAQMHCKDLVENLGFLTHAWSTCKYEAGDIQTYSCMWQKPSELTSYKGYGYECAHGGTGGYIATAESSLQSWKNSTPHNDVILNKGIWNNKWNAIGVGILNGFACIWFGKEYDNQIIKNESTQPIPIYNKQMVNSNSYTTIYKKKHKLLSLKLGGSVNLLSEDFKSLGRTSINNELAYQINTMIGINLGKHKKNTSFGIFGNYGKYNSKNTTLLNNTAFLSKDDFIEIESGFLIKEFFRLSGGVGYSNFNSISFNSYDYSTITAGFSFGPRWFKLDVTNTLMKIRNNEKYFYRPSLGISIVLNTLNKKT